MKAVNCFGVLQGVKTYGLQSGCDSGSTKFNQEMAKVTNGKHLALKNFSNIFDFIMMICYGEGNPDMLPVSRHIIKTNYHVVLLLGR